MSVTLITHYVPTESENYQELADLNIVNRDEYCNRHGYIHHVHKGSYGDPTLYYAYQRLKLVRDLMDKPDATKLFWVLNVSSIITNMLVPLEDFVNPVWQYDFLISKDVHGINAGSMIFSNTEWSRKWLDFLISLEPKYRNDDWHEQRAIMHWWMHEDWTHKIMLLQQNDINSYEYRFYPPWNEETPGQWGYGDLVLALPGIDLPRRLAITKSEQIKRYIKR